MTVLAAPGDTWGISGPEFLVGYVVLAAVVIWLTFMLRRGVVARAGSDVQHGDLDPFAYAVLYDGSTRAVHAALAGLRARELISASTEAGIVATRPSAAGMHPIELAVYQAIAGGRNQTRTIATEPGVRAAVAVVREQMVRAGLMLTGPQRTLYRLFGLLPLPVLLIGMVRFWDGAANNKPVTYLIILLIALVVAQLAFVVGGAPTWTKAGSTVIYQHRTRHEHLKPSLNPSWAAYGAMGAAMGVAVFGTSALIAADPAFAAEAQLRQLATGGGSGSGDMTSYNSSCSSSSSCSSGSSCSSSSCGGGGCGG